MCLSIPFKVISVKNNQAIVVLNNQKLKVNSRLVKVKKGDYVLIQNNVIIKKINKKEALKWFNF